MRKERIPNTQHLEPPFPPFTVLLRDGLHHLRRGAGGPAHHRAADHPLRHRLHACLRGQQHVRIAIRKLRARAVSGHVGHRRAVPGGPGGGAGHARAPLQLLSVPGGHCKSAAAKLASSVLIVLSWIIRNGEDLLLDSALRYLPLQRILLMYGIS
jgi:hypothetical protein